MWDLVWYRARDQDGLPSKEVVTSEQGKQTTSYLQLSREALSVRMCSARNTLCRKPVGQQDEARVVLAAIVVKWKHGDGDGIGQGC